MGGGTSQSAGPTVERRSSIEESSNAGNESMTTKRMAKEAEVFDPHAVPTYSELPANHVPALRNVIRLLMLVWSPIWHVLSSASERAFDPS